ncbi:MAG: phage tail protein [Prevotellaceae bacterium]|jgi:TP901-1 family phage major tail protein|nr:phage tail protein [Prevotellaceae bacterium]
MAVVKGKDLMLFKKTGSTLVALGAATNHTLSISAEVQETSNKDTGKWGTSQPGRYSWTMGTENMLVKADYDTLIAEMIAGTLLHVVFEVASNASADEVPEGGWTPANGGWEGDVYITQIDTNAPYEDKATYSATFTGVGALAKRTVSTGT